MLKIKYILLFSLFCHFRPCHTQCNGSLSLCNKKFNEVAFLTTHNAYNSSQGNFSLPNQNFNIVTQLNNGVRGLMIDVYDSFGTLLVYHGSQILGSQPFVDYLNQINTFLSNNSNEIVVLILECYADANSIENVINQSGLNTYLFTHDSIQGWPSLQTMINNNERLVIFSDENDAGPNQQWYHYVWDYAVETHYSVNNQNDFTCDFNRGDSLNDLFIFNHFVTTPLGTGDENASLAANSNPFFWNRVLQCQQEKNKFPNFITVDFYDLGNAHDVVNQLNEVVTTIEESIGFSATNLKVFPNPSNQFINIELGNKVEVPYSITIYSSIGKQLFFESDHLEKKLKIEYKLPKELCLIVVQDKNNELYTLSVINK